MTLLIWHTLLHQDIVPRVMTMYSPGLKSTYICRSALHMTQTTTSPLRYLACLLQQSRTAAHTIHCMPISLTRGTKRRLTVSSPTVSILTYHVVAALHPGLLPCLSL